MFTHIYIHTTYERKMGGVVKFWVMMPRCIAHETTLHSGATVSFQAFTYYYVVMVLFLEEPENNPKSK
jgi:hypothetical protein